MKKLLLITICYLFATTAQAQDRYKIDGNSIVVSAVVEDIQGSKDDIYGRAKSYFARAYNNSKEVTQTDDKVGGLIVIKGLYTNLASHSLGAWTLKAFHTIRVDIKENRARIICSAETIIPNSSSYPGNTYEYVIVDRFPVTNKTATGATKGSQEKAFENLINLMNESVGALSVALKEGGVLETEKEDW